MLQRLREDPDAEADVVSYASAIMACERGGRCEEALTLFDDMKRAALEPTAYIYMVRLSVEVVQARNAVESRSSANQYLMLTAVLTHGHWSSRLALPLTLTLPTARRC